MVTEPEVVGKKDRGPLCQSSLMGVVGLDVGLGHTWNMHTGLSLALETLFPPKNSTSNIKSPDENTTDPVSNP